MKKLDFEKMGGLIPAVIQNAEDKSVLMVGFMNENAYKKTEKEGYVTFWSRSKKRLWTKGEESGNFLKVVEIKEDCDSDSLLILVNPMGNTCHKGAPSCFDNFFEDLFKNLKERRKKMPEDSYTAALLKEGKDKILEKVEEECEEVVRAAQSEGKQRLIEESCDLLYHLFVLLVAEEIELKDLEGELQKRKKVK